MDALARAWREAIDWRQSRAVAEGEPGGGFVRLNLAGREPDGIVEPERGEEVLEELTNDLMALEDPDSGRPAIAAVHRLTDPGSGAQPEQLPDLAVEWTSRTRVRRVLHPRVGIIHDAPNVGPRYEHEGRGFLVAGGPSVNSAAGGTVRDVDLAPTLLHLLGCAIPEQMAGTVIEGLIDVDRPVVRAPIDISADPFA